MFGIDNGIKNLILKVVDETIGKKYKAVDDFTDLFQGLEPEIKKLKETIIDLENIAKAHEDRLDKFNETLLLIQYQFKQICADSMFNVKLEKDK